MKLNSGGFVFFNFKLGNFSREVRKKYFSSYSNYPLSIVFLKKKKASKQTKQHHFTFLHLFSVVDRSYWDKLISGIPLISVGSQ